jgi:hypothetical protein
MDEVAVVGANGTAQGVVVFEMSAESEGKNCRVAEAIGDDTRMIALCLLIHPGFVF